MNNNISMGFSCGTHYYAGEEPEVPLIDETTRREKQQQQQSMDHVQVQNDHEGFEVVELYDFEFWPVEHPSEPPDEDHPLKCPMPDSSVINDGVGTGRLSESNYSSAVSRKRTEVSSAAKIEFNKQGMDDQSMDEMVVATDQPPPPRVPVRAVRKRHHTQTRGAGDHIISPLRRMPPHPPHHLTVFQMLQQLDKHN